MARTKESQSKKWAYANLLQQLTLYHRNRKQGRASISTRVEQAKQSLMREDLRIVWDDRKVRLMLLLARTVNKLQLWWYYETVKARNCWQEENLIYWILLCLWLKIKREESFTDGFDKIIWLKWYVKLTSTLVN